MQDSHTSSTFLQTLKPPNFPEHEQLKCPRCDSTNTKFCYYNNYNLSQPRHFCKSCRRYWTKGGALRNIPVGGGTRRSAAKRSSKPKNRQIPCTDDEAVVSSSKPPLTGFQIAVPVPVPAPTPEPNPSQICNYLPPSMDSTRICGIAVGPDNGPGPPPVRSFSLPLTGPLQNPVPVSVPAHDSEPTRIHGLVMNQNQLDGHEAKPVQSSSKPLSTGLDINPVRVNDPARMYNGEFSSLLESNGQFLKLLQGGSGPNGPGLGLGPVRFSGFGMDGVVYGTHPGRVPGANVSEEGQSGNSGCWSGGNGWPDLAIFTPGSGFQ